MTRKVFLIMLALVLALSVGLVACDDEKEEQEFTEEDEFLGSVGKVILITPTGQELTIDLTGPTTVHVFFEGEGEGEASDDDGDGLDEVSTEIVDMKLTGLSPLGPVEVHLNPDPDKRSIGEIEEITNNTPGMLDLPPFTTNGTADSYFFVYFELVMGEFTFRTEEPKLMQTVISHKPPQEGDTYQNPDIIPLVDVQGLPTGYSVGTASHTPVPPSEVELGITIPFKNLGTFVFQTIDPIETLDPAWIYDTASAQQVGVIYETLLYFEGEKTDEFIPVLAEEWELNPADLTFRFKIRKDVKFHSGNDLTPEDVEYSFERWMVMDRTGGPTWMIYGPLLDVGGSGDVTFADIDGAVEVDGDFVVFTLAGGAHWELAFLQILCGGWASIVDKKFCIAQGDWDGTEATWMDYNKPADVGDTVLYNQSSGTGPWRLNLWEPGIQVKVERNDDYWGGSAPFDYIITQVVEEWTSRKLALQGGDADLVYVPATHFDEMDDIESATEDLKVYKDLPSLSIDAFLFNQDIAPESTYVGSGVLDGMGIPSDFFTDLDVRKGFSYAFEFETYIRDGLHGQGVQRGSPVVAGLPFFNPDTSMYSLDLEKAAEHLRVAWGGQVWEKGFKMTLLYDSGNIPRKTACEILAGNLYAINPLFQVSTQPISWPTFLGKIWGTRDMPMFQIDWLPGYPHPDNFVVPFMHSTAGAFSAYIGYGSPELDAKIEAAFEETDPVVQQALYSELQEICYQDPYGITLAQPIARRYFTKYIHGFYYNPAEPSYPGRFIDLTKSES